MICHTFK